MNDFPGWPDDFDDEPESTVSEPVIPPMTPQNSAARLWDRVLFARPFMHKSHLSSSWSAFEMTLQDAHFHPAFEITLRSEQLAASEEWVELFRFHIRARPMPWHLLNGAMATAEGFYAWPGRIQGICKIGPLCYGLMLAEVTLLSFMIFISGGTMHPVALFLVGCLATALNSLFFGVSLQDRNRLADMMIDALDESSMEGRIGGLEPREL